MNVQIGMHLTSILFHIDVPGEHNNCNKFNSCNFTSVEFLPGGVLLLYFIFFYYLGAPFITIVIILQTRTQNYDRKNICFVGVGLNVIFLCTLCLVILLWQMVFAPPKFELETKHK